jgi:hypothetical protein
MTSLPQPLPRFIPTLTQIVDNPNRLAHQPETDPAALFSSIWLQIEPILKRRIAEEVTKMIRTALTEKGAEIENLLHDEMRLFAQQAVLDAMPKKGNE